MRWITAVLAATCSLGLGGTAAAGAISAAAATAGPVAGAPALAASCVYGKIGGVTKCLRAGEYCARRHRRQYLRYGFSCTKRDYRGNWHLVST